MTSRRMLSMAVSVVLAIVLGVPTQISSAWAAGPYLSGNGVALDGATLPAPFTAVVTDPGTVSAAGVTFLVDNSYAGKDTSAPFQWTVTSAAGPHKLKARWVDSTGATVEVVANFTVQASTSPVLKANGAALEGASVTSPFKAVVEDTGTVDTNGVTFLLDDSYVGKDTSAPYEWTVVTGAGSHKLKARWTNGSGALVESVANFTVTSAANPYLKAGDVPLDGATVPAPFTASVAEPGTVTADGVTFLVDDVYAGKDASAPFEWQVTAAEGAHKLKARWATEQGLVLEVVANFTVGPAAPADPPRLLANGTPLEGGAQLTVPFTITADATGPVGTEGVLFLVDDDYVGKDTAAPYEFTFTAENVTAGQRKIKAKWTDTSGEAKEIVSYFVAVVPGQDPPEAVPAKVVVPPGPALKRLWVTKDNRRNQVEGMYDWSQAGTGGGEILADYDEVLRDEDECRITPAELAADYDVKPDDGANDTSGLQRAIDDIRTNCSPTGSYLKMSKITLPKGELNVTRQISIDADYLRIRGQGSGQGGTRLVFRPDDNTRYDKITADGTRWDLDAMTEPAVGDSQPTGGWIWPGRGMFRVQSRKVHPDYQAA